MKPNLDQNQPLTGLTILVTRPLSQANSLAQSLQSRGATLLIEPVIEILPPEDWHDIDQTINRIADDSYSSIVFVSANGVRFLFDRMTELGRPVDMGNLRVISIGKGTAKALSGRGIAAQTVLGKAESNSVADYLIENQTAGKVLIIRANRGSKVLPDRLAKENIDFEQVVAYRSVDCKVVSPEAKRLLEAGLIDWVTVTSSAIAQSMVRLFGSALEQTKLVSISPATSGTLRELGFDPSAEAETYNMQGIVDAIVSVVKPVGKVK